MAIRVGIIGLGWAGMKHLDTLSRLEGAEVAAVADLDPARARQAAERLGVRAYRDCAALLEGEIDLDAVVLATPPAVRLEPIESVCDREVALFCEKPPALGLDAARKAAREIRRAGIIHAVGFQYRWSLCAAAFRELIRRQPRLFTRIVVAWPVLDWVKQGRAPISLLREESSGGPLVEQGIHFLDALRYVTGDEPVAVQAMAEIGHTHDRTTRDSEETTAVLVRHESGMLTTHVHNWSHHGARLELQIVGPSFDLTWKMEGGERLTGWVEGASIDEGSGVDPHIEEVRGFLEAVRRKDQSLVKSDFADACRSLAVCLAAAEAVETGRTVPVRRWDR